MAKKCFFLFICKYLLMELPQKKLYGIFLLISKTGLTFAPAKANGGIAQLVRAHDS